MQLIKPKLSDIAEMQNLVKPFIEDGIILPRSDEEVANTIRSYTIAKNDQNKIVGFSSLFIYTDKLAEVRSLVVSKEFQGQKIGSEIVLKLIEEARSLGLMQLITLTYRASFFTRLGFKQVPKEEVWHHKIWEDCIRCKHFPVCNEIALILSL
ncbi:MAG: N-acetyltransferase [Helicobacteraceae bacterium]|jgi:amino-acid N-acetyltransferase|nr:N-acetyltransferase [Helicobacteraceae bacterium]